MTQFNLLDLAKQGNPEAIAALMNRPLATKGITATVDLQGDSLNVVLEAAQVPNPGALVPFVQNGLKSLGILSLHRVRVSGQQQGASVPAWAEEFVLYGAAPPPPPPTPAAPAAPATPMPPAAMADDLPTTQLPPEADEILAMPSASAASAPSADQSVMGAGRDLEGEILAMPSTLEPMAEAEEMPPMPSAAEAEAYAAPGSGDGAILTGAVAAGLAGAGRGLDEFDEGPENLVAMGEDNTAEAIAREPNNFWEVASVTEELPEFPGETLTPLEAIAQAQMATGMMAGNETAATSAGPDLGLEDAGTMPSGIVAMPPQEGLLAADMVSPSPNTVLQDVESPLAADESEDYGGQVEVVEDIPQFPAEVSPPTYEPDEILLDGGNASPDLLGDEEMALIDAADMPLDDMRPDAQPVGTAGDATPSRSPWYIVILLVMLGWLGALIGYPLWSELSNPEVQPIPSPVPPTGEPTDAETGAAEPSGEPLQDALNTASRALTLAQSAQSVDDWGLVASQWQQAITLLQAIPASSPNYGEAQAKIAEYQGNLSAAQQQASSQAEVTQAPPLSTVAVSGAGEITCPPVEPGPDAPAVELTDLQFEAVANAAEGDYIVGCITNHTDQPVTSVALSYQGSSVADSDVFQGGFNNISFASLEAGSTIPFRSSFTVNPEVMTVTIQSIYWTSQGASEPQQLESTLSVSR